MRDYSIISGFISLYTNRSLLMSLIIRDIQSRYRGTTLGFLWIILYPLMMLFVYTYVFAGIFSVRWQNGGGVKDFVLMLYCGLIVHALVSDTLLRSTTAIVANPSYVKKVVFPLEILPLSQLASSIFNAIIGLLLLSIFQFIEYHALPYSAIYVPLILLPLLILTAGLAWFFAAIGVFFRDITQIMGVAMSLLLFLSPVFYPASAAPEVVRKILFLNPLTVPIENIRTVLILGQQPDWWQWSAYFLAGIFGSVLAMWFFQKTRRVFADVI